jgi:hypothetical protein
MSTRRRKPARHRAPAPPASNRRKPWVAVGIVLALVLAAGAFVHPHGAFGIDASFGFAAWFGFGACAALIVIGRLLGLILERRDDYYDR